MNDRTKSMLTYQSGQRQKTIDAIELAKKAIKAELEQHGYYPQNGGRLSKLEVLRRAAVSAQTLKNATHKETSEALDRWLNRIKKTAPTLRAEAGDAKTQKIADLEQKLVAIAAHYDRFKLEHNEALIRIEQLETENAELRRQLAAGTKVLVLKGKDSPG